MYKVVLYQQLRGSNQFSTDEISNLSEAGASMMKQLLMAGRNMNVYQVYSLRIEAM